jgi:tetratricopeptide (TPR) repeat protein
MSMLGFIAALQVCAVLWHYSPAIKQVVQNNAMSTQTVPVPTPAAQQAPPIRPIAPTADAMQIQQLFEEANLKFRLGDFQVALRTLEKLDTLSPNDPKALWMKALVLEKMDQPAEAVLQLEALLRVPGLPSADRANIAKKVDQLAEALGGSSAPTTGSNTNALAGESGTEMRSESGIRAGATLGIVNIRNKDDKRGMKTLSVAVKSLPNAKVVGDQVKILAYFYEQTEDGGVDITTSKIVSQWMSPPIDWADDEPELLDLQYTLPGNEDGLPGRKYAGYVVGLYYKGELQDFRSDPARLAVDFPLPLDDPQ